MISFILNVVSNTHRHTQIFTAVVPNTFLKICTQINIQAIHNGLFCCCVFYSLSFISYNVYSLSYHFHYLFFFRWIFIYKPTIINNKTTKHLIIFLYSFFVSILFVAVVAMMMMMIIAFALNIFNRRKKLKIRTKTLSHSPYQLFSSRFFLLSPPRMI